MIKLDEGHASTLICTKGKSLLEIWRTLNMEGGRGEQAELAGCEWGHISTIFISPNQNSLLSVFIGIIYDVISLLLLSQRSAVGLKQNYYSYTTAYVCMYVCMVKVAWGCSCFNNLPSNLFYRCNKTLKQQGALWAQPILLLVKLIFYPPDCWFRIEELLWRLYV